MSEESTDNTISSQETEEYSESEEVDFLDGLTNEQKVCRSFICKSFITIV